MNTIKYFNGLCGSGKTASALKLTETILKLKGKVAIVSPSIELQDETERRFKALIQNKNDFKITKINSKTHKFKGPMTGVRESIESHIRLNVPGLLLITHDGFLRVENWSNKDKWTIFIDEEILPMQSTTFIFEKTSEDSTVDVSTKRAFIDMIEELINFENYDDSNYRITVKNKKLNSKILRGQIQNSFYKLVDLVNFSKHLSQKNYNILCLKTQFDNFFSGAANKISFQAEINLDCFKGFRNLYLLGAQIDKSFMMEYFKNKDFECKQINHPNQTEEQKHQQPITINWACDQKIWSQNFAKKMNEESRETNLKTYQNLVRQEMKNKTSCLVQNNKNFPWPEEFKNKVELPYKSEGLNTFSHHDHYAESGAYNWTPEFINVLKMKNFDTDQLLIDNSVRHAYQGLMRSSLRLGKFKNNQIFVPTLSMALELKMNYFPNANVERISTAENYFQKTTTMTPSIRVLKHKNSKKLDNLILTNKEQIQDKRTEIELTYFATTKSKNSQIEKYENFDTLVNFLSDANQLHCKKEHAMLFINGGTTSRKEENFYHINPIICLDIDGGKITPEKFAEILPDVRMAIYPSFNHMKENQNRFRVLFELDTAASNLDEQRIITKKLTEYITQKVNENRNKYHTEIVNLYDGNDEKGVVCNHADELAANDLIHIDECSYKPTQLWYMPGINRENKKHKFFINQQGKALIKDQFLNLDTETVVEKVIYINNDVLKPIMTRINATGPGRRNKDYCKIVGYIRNNRNKITLTELNTVFGHWQSVDPDKNRYRNFFKDIS